MSKRKIALMGAGAWGTALAQSLAGAGQEIILWTRKEEHAAAMRQAGENQKYLAGISLNPSLTITADLADITECQDIYLVIPSQYLAGFLLEMSQLPLLPDSRFILCSKGIDIASGKFLSQLVHEHFPDHEMGILSGPTFAIEVAQGLPAAATIASDHATVRQSVGRAFQESSLRVYFSDDLMGLEIAGAVKNVIAIACGIVAGRSFGLNARAALMTRGLSEMAQLAMRCGARLETMMGLAGLGDLSLTCHATQSRNYMFGYGLGEGQSPDWQISQRHTIVEGATSSISVTNLAREKQVEMPICEAIRAIIHDQADIDDTIKSLLQRPLRAEISEFPK